MDVDRTSDKERFDAIQERAKKLGVRDMNFSGSKDIIKSYESALDIIEDNMNSISGFMGWKQK